MTQTAPDAEMDKEHRLICVTGPSGAGRTTAINTLEDLGYETIDNMPLELSVRLLEGPPLGRPLALGINARTRGFSVAGFLELFDSFDRNPNIMASLLYLDCSADALLRRYSETRRRHPFAPSQHPSEGIAQELELLEPLRQRADFLINTSEMTPHDLRAELHRWFAGSENPGLAVSVHSFSYRRGVPRGLDMVFDCRFLRNPHWEPGLRARDGRDPEVAAHIRADSRFGVFLSKVRDLIEFLLPAHAEEGKAHLAIGFGCTGGQHRSVMMVESVAAALAQSGWRVSKRHRELERRSDRGTGVKAG
ncbi:RNase adapter RapZ [Alkalilacustris brevis]|uniref:RNase adapter RapZ n=1 Tax=Alkalilacustris brevis TaxID=2026338 RepID=UPI000E0D1ACA|nr:RNase adapter RapZ [Alkalilacustris brevis]